MYKRQASTDTQQRYLNESIATATVPTQKVNTANVEVYLNQPWTSGEYKAVSKQLQQLAGITEYPGHYIVPTYVKNAFYEVYNTCLLYTSSFNDFAVKVKLQEDVWDKFAF